MFFRRWILRSLGRSARKVQVSSNRAGGLTSALAACFRARRIADSISPREVHEDADGFGFASKGSVLLSELADEASKATGSEGGYHGRAPMTGSRYLQRSLDCEICSSA